MAGPRSANVTGAQRNGWTPTVANLLILVALEIAAYCALRWVFRTAHGG